MAHYQRGEDGALVPVKVEDIDLSKPWFMAPDTDPVDVPTAKPLPDGWVDVGYVDESHGLGWPKVFGGPAR